MSYEGEGYYNHKFASQAVSDLYAWDDVGSHLHNQQQKYYRSRLKKMLYTQEWQGKNQIEEQAYVWRRQKNCEISLFTGTILFYS